MKQNSVFNWLVPLIAILALVLAGVGVLFQDGGIPFEFFTVHGKTIELYGNGIYRNDSLFAGALFRGTDVITLFVCIPLLLVSFFLYRRGSLRGSILFVSMLVYFLYVGVTYTFSVAFNSLFLVYTALLSVSLFAAIIAMTTFDTDTLA